MRILFTRETGVTVDNVAPGLFSIMTQSGVDNQGCFFIDTLHPTDSIRQLLLQEGYNNVAGSTDRLVVMSNAVTVGSPTVDGEIPNPPPGANLAARQAPVVPDYPPIPAQPGVHVVTPAVGVQQAPVVPGYAVGDQMATPAPTPAATVAPATAAPIVDDFDPEEDPDEEDAYEESAPYTIPTVNEVEITDEVVLDRLMTIVPPEDARAIKLCTDKVREYNRIMGQAIGIKRQIDGMMHEIDANEVNAKLREDVEYLTTRCEDVVESVTMGDDAKLIITTKPVTTDNLPRYGARLLGRMRFIIDLAYLYAQIPPTTKFDTAIDIQNLDNNPVSGDSYWACGHVHHYPNAEKPNICFGSYYQHIFDACVAGQVSQLFDILMRFIKGPDESDSWGCKVSLFPRVTMEVANEA